MSEDTEIMRTLGRLEGKIDRLIDSHDLLRADHEITKASLASVKNRMHWYGGALATLGAGWAFLRSYIPSFPVL